MVGILYWWRIDTSTVLDLDEKREVIFISDF
jgi:hypothetical protein